MQYTYCMYTVFPHQIPLRVKRNSISWVCLEKNSMYCHSVSATDCNSHHCVHSAYLSSGPPLSRQHCWLDHWWPARLWSLWSAIAARRPTIDRTSYLLKLCTLNIQLYVYIRPSQMLLHPKAYTVKWHMHAEKHVRMSTLEAQYCPAHWRRVNQHCT